MHQPAGVLRCIFFFSTNSTEGDSFVNNWNVPNVYEYKKYEIKDKPGSSLSFDNTHKKKDILLFALLIFLNLSVFLPHLLTRRAGNLSMKYRE